jgi:predicted RNA-binding Zn ribbon-like protein
MGIDKRSERRHSGGDVTFPRLLGERLCLDFANTVESPRGVALDFLPDYTALVRWGRHSDLLDDTQVARLVAKATRHPVRAEAAFGLAIALRAAVQRTFAAIAARSDPAEADLATIQRVYISGLAHARLEERDGRREWEWSDEVAHHLDGLLWPIARSAVELLTRGDPARVKECAGPEGCGWLFYDLSKNASRRWCSMEGCGSQAKMRRYHARRRRLGKGES